METSDICRTLEEWRHGTTYLAGESWEAEIIALYDHDYEYHLLLMVRSDTAETYYGLFFIGVSGNFFVERWEHTESGHPWVEASVYVAGWAELGRLTS